MLKVIVKIVLIFVLLITLPYYRSVFYSLEKNQPFSGDTFYNPYESTAGNWLKSNFHSHSKIAFGLTNGDNSIDEMLDTYDSMNYDLPCLSNYNSLTKYPERKVTLNVYEHGMNLGFTHQLVFNTNTASKFDFPLFQFTGQKQFGINRLKTPDNLIALAHPSFKFGYSFDDLSYLKNYDLMEVVSHRASSIPYWDHALSSGKMVWAIGNDDSHSTDEGGCGIAWTMVRVNDTTSDAFVHSLRNGNCYAVKGWKGIEMNELDFLEVDNGLYTLKMKHAADSITLFGDDGKLLASIVNSDQLTYQIKNSDTYVRAEVFETEPWNTYTKFYINPVIRSNSDTFHNQMVELDISWFKTISFLIVLIIVHFLMLRFVWKW